MLSVRHKVCYVLATQLTDQRLTFQIGPKYIFFKHVIINPLLAFSSNIFR